MNITVFGASGHIGRLVVSQLLTRGDSVTAFIHGSSPFDDNDRLTILHGDIHSANDVESALQDAEAIVSCLGSWHTPTKDILSAAMKSVIPAAEKHGIKRIISLTGAAALTPGDSLGLIDKLNHYALSKVAPKILRDGEEHIKLLAQSSLDWTVIRSPIMKNGTSEHYYLDTHAPNPLATINRAAIVSAMVGSIHDDQYIHIAPYIHRGQ